VEEAGVCGRGGCGSVSYTLFFSVSFLRAYLIVCGKCGKCDGDLVPNWM